MQVLYLALVPILLAIWCIHGHIYKSASDTIHERCLGCVRGGERVFSGCVSVRYAGSPCWGQTLLSQTQYCSDAGRTDCACVNDFVVT